MPILGVAAKFLLKAFATDPKGVLKIIGFVIILPIILLASIFLAPLAIFTHIPLVDSEKHQLYVDVVNQIEKETNVLIDWNHLVGIDAVLFQQDFSESSQTHIEDIAWRFIDEYEVEKEREIEVEGTCEEENEDGEIVEESCMVTEIETYTVTRYRLIPLETVLNNIVSNGLMHADDIESVERYIAFAGMASTEIDLDNLPEITDGIFMRPATGRITSGFGPRWGRLHAGVDIGGGGRSGVPIVAIADGVVRRSYHSTSFGETVMIVHNINGTMYESVYAHMVSGSRLFQEGQMVNKGDVIGVMGTTGRSTGVHLHFELHKGGTWNVERTNAVNPLHYVDFN